MRNFGIALGRGVSQNQIYLGFKYYYINILITIMTVTN